MVFYLPASNNHKAPSPTDMDTSAPSTPLGSSGPSTPARKAAQAGAAAESWEDAADHSTASGCSSNVATTPDEEDSSMETDGATGGHKVPQSKPKTKVRTCLVCLTCLKCLSNEAEMSYRVLIVVP